MKQRTIVWFGAIMTAALATACDKNAADDVAKAQQESARIQGEADEKVAEANRQAARAIAEANKEAGEEKAEARRDVAEERRELQESIREARQETKDEYKDYAQKRARLLELEAAAIKADTSVGSPAASNEFGSRIKEIEDKHRSVLNSLGEADKADNDKWSSMKAKINTELNDIEQSLDKLKGDSNPGAPTQ